jgi:prolyl-tRNA editing enzyme YbaK/EbsC (Cys-tRNA(Pro) deacylase)
VNSTARRIAEVRAREWRALGAHGRAASRSLGNDCQKLVAEHPEASIAAAAVIGLTALLWLRKPRDSAQRKSSESARAPRARRAHAHATGGIFTQILSKAIVGWILEKLAPQEPTQPR